VTDALPRPLEGSIWFGCEPVEPDIYTLPLAVQHIEGESIVGLIVRNAESLDYPNPAFVLMPLGLHRGRLAVKGLRPLDPAVAREFAALLALDPATFDRMHHGSPLPRTANLFGHAVTENFVSLSHRKVCPLCLRDSPHHQAIWNMSLLTVCPRHACYLVNRCPSCSRFLTWSTASVARCSSLACQASLLDAPVSPASAENMDGVRGLVDIVLGHRALPETVTSLNSAMRFSFDLGLIAYGRRGRGRAIAFSEEHPDAVVDVLNVGWRALQHWPGGFRSFLEDLRLHADRRRGRYGVNKEFGLLPEWLSEVQGQPDVAALTAEFVAYASEQVDLATRALQVRRERSTGPLTDQFITATEGKRLLNVTYKRLHELAIAHELWLVPPDGSGAPGLLLADKFRKFVGDVESCLTKADAADLLAVSKETFWTIEAAGVLPVIPKPSRLLRERPYRRQDVDNLLAALEATAPSARPGRKLVTIDTVARGGANIGSILSAILAGKLAPQAVDAKAQGLRRLLFKPQWILDTLGFTDQTMSAKEAADKLGVKEEVVYEWVRRGLLRTVAGTTKAEAGSRITPEALDDFRKEYVTGVELAATVGSRSRRHSSPQLMELGLTPVSGPSVDGARQYLFRRADAENRSLRPLRDFVQGKTPQPKRSEAWALARHVGRAAAGFLGLELGQTKNSFVDSAGTTVVQVVTGRRNGFRGAYRFIVLASQIRRLDEAHKGYLALGFVGLSWFLLIPWQQADTVLRRRSTSDADVFVNVDRSECPGALAEFRRDLGA